MKKIILTALAAVALTFAACNDDSGDKSSDPIHRQPNFDTVYTVYADYETEPVDAAVGSDAADDPAIWINPDDLANSLIFGTNKKGGIGVYTLEGDEKSFFPFGDINNVDVTYGFSLGGEKIDFCGGTNRSRNSLDLYKIDKQTGELTFALAEPKISDVDDVYGFCFYKSPKSKKYYAFLCGKNGQVEQYEITDEGEFAGLTKVRTIEFESQNEGMVADDQNAVLYVGEEGKGVWKVDAEPDGTEKTFIAHSDEAGNPNIEYDVEGLTLYRDSKGGGYLIVSSQGNDTYAVFERTGDNGYIGSFQIEPNDANGVDGTQETDGIDVCNFAFGEIYPQGFFIAQDGANAENGRRLPQNFKMVRWERIAEKFDPPLTIDEKFNPRSIFE